MCDVDITTDERENDRERRGGEGRKRKSSVSQRSDLHTQNKFVYSCINTDDGDDVLEGSLKIFFAPRVRVEWY